MVKSKTTLAKEITNKINPEVQHTVAYNPDKEELEVRDYLIKRIDVLKETKSSILNGVNYLDIMKSADREYAPKLYTQGDNKGRGIFIQDETTGLRGSRLVQGVSDDDNWKSNVSEPVLWTKIQTALSILVDQNPEATFKAVQEKYKINTVLAKAIWKRSWELAGSKEALKLVIFDIAKYGWGIGKTYPRIIKRDKQVLESLDVANPENNVYRKDTIVEFNDIFRKRLDPFRTWIDDQTNLADPFSMRDWYYEEDYSKDSFEEEFGEYTNSKYVKFGAIANKDDSNSEQSVQRDDLVTVGFYESKKDLYTIWIPDQNIVLYKSPLPNDDGKLTCWWSYWTIRDPRTPYGIGLYEIIKNDKILYDRLRNMTIDQLVLAIYPMLFYAGPPVQGDGDMKLSPNVIKQKLPGTTIDQVKIQYDQRGWDAVTHLTEDIDNVTGISPTLQGQVEGKTLGEVLHAKDAALKRLNIPLANIAYTLQQEAFITLSWAKQVYSVPEIKEFVDLAAYEKDLIGGGDTPDELKAIQGGGIEASYYKNLDLGLKQNRSNVLIESPENTFMSSFGLDFKWEGRITVKAQSIISTSQELERQRKLELFNLVSPVVQTMAMLFYQHVDPKTGQAYTPEGGKEVAISMYPPLKQILEIQDEKPENWIPKEILLVAEKPEILQQQKQAGAQSQQMSQPLFVDQNEGNAPQPGQTPPPPNTGTPGAMPAPTAPANNQGAPTVVPQGQISNPLRASMAQVERPR